MNSFPEKTFTVTPTMYGRIIRSRICVLIGVDDLSVFAVLMSLINFLLLSLIPLVKDLLALAVNTESSFSNDKPFSSFSDNPL